MRLKVLALAVAGAVVLPLFVGCTPGGGKGPDAPTPFVVAGDLPTARLAPVLVVNARSPIHVPVALTNSTKDELTYAVDAKHADEAELYNLQGSLYRDGRLVKEERVMYDEPQFQMNQVRRLKPGAAVTLHYRLPYTKVKPGRYELRLIYQIHPKSGDETKHGLTAIKLEQTMILDVREE